MKIVEVDAHELGILGEAKALQFLERQGFVLVGAIYKTKLGEIDIFALKGKTYHFIEVKTRRGTQFGLGCEAISKKKQLHIKRTAMIYVSDMYQNNVDWDELSFDFIEIYVYNDNTCRIRFIEDAF